MCLFLFHPLHARFSPPFPLSISPIFVCLPPPPPPAYTHRQHTWPVEKSWFPGTLTPPGPTTARPPPGPTGRVLDNQGWGRGWGTILCSFTGLDHCQDSLYTLRFTMEFFESPKLLRYKQMYCVVPCTLSVSVLIIQYSCLLSVCMVSGAIVGTFHS